MAPSQGTPTAAKASQGRMRRPEREPRGSISASRVTLGDAGLMTFEECAAALGITHQRVAQIERQALRKCRAWCERHGYQLADLLPEASRRTEPEAFSVRAFDAWT